VTDAARDELQHLPTLHYALAGVTAVATALAAMPVSAGWHALAHPNLPDYGPVGPPSLSGWIFLLGGALAILLGTALAVGLAAAGRWIALRRNHTLCVAVAMAATFFFPLGTLLGFHTINCLSTPAALRAFGLEPRGG
jgi:hypothetical protein